MRSGDVEFAQAVDWDVRVLRVGLNQLLIILHYRVLVLRRLHSCVMARKPLHGSIMIEQLLGTVVGFIERDTELFDIPTQLFDNLVVLLSPPNACQAATVFQRVAALTQQVFASSQSPRQEPRRMDVLIL
ncbi:uncharacterized protein LTR77_000516 [Saxophila tyrrhenica]|uniref:Uncharacterized protein n=1 Tax=Saxophila tyrrhenica TaxID=1690608 RepID=A0AAV9PRD3_9PEZI|nr:hypothetical protein LTR77_000516 [Saxophila tyrrhenica]